MQANNGFPGGTLKSAQFVKSSRKQARKGEETPFLVVAMAFRD